MTTVYKKVEKVIEREEFVSCTCDRCGKELGEDYGNEHPDTREFTLRFEKGYSGYGDTWGNGWEVQDLCDDCVGFLQTLLENNGIKTTRIEW